jgi:triosephosphate isomerase
MPIMAKIIVANWKMNPTSFDEAKAIVKGVSDKTIRGVEMVLCPPALYLGALQIAFKKRKLEWGAQNGYSDKQGAHTGEISFSMYKKMGVKFAIIGHSERRAMGESDKDVSLKIASALKEQITPVVCIGEKERDQSGNYLEVLKNQVLASLSGVTSSMMKKIILAYEPVWAIGKDEGSAMNAQVLHETSLYIRKVLVDNFGKGVKDTPILYGGSVAVENAYSLVKMGEVDGLLVGHHSLKVDEFRKILTEVARV